MSRPGVPGSQCLQQLPLTDVRQHRRNSNGICGSAEATGSANGSSFLLFQVPTQHYVDASHRQLLLRNATLYLHYTMVLVPAADAVDPSSDSTAIEMQQPNAPAQQPPASRNETKNASWWRRHVAQEVPFEACRDHYGSSAITYATLL